MRKKLISLTLSVCMIFGSITTSIYAGSTDELIKKNIIENKGDTYTLVNYVTSPEEAKKIEKYYLLNNISDSFKITIDAKSYDNWLRYDEDSEKIDRFYSEKFMDEIDNGLGKYCRKNCGIDAFFEQHELLTDNNGKKYIVLNLKTSNADQFLEQLTKLQEVRDKFLATMPNPEEMSDYEKILSILSFMSYIKYSKTDEGRTINDAYTALVEGKATCSGFADAFNLFMECNKDMWKMV